MVLPVENDESIISRESRSRDATVAPFSIIAIHDGYRSEIQVNQAFSWLHQSFRADMRMTFNAWTFEKLVSALDIRAMSVRIGIEADMIIIATPSGEPLPDHIKRWLDSITRERKKRAMVLALEQDAHSPCAQISKLCEDLQQWASRWQAELICCTDIHHPPSRQSILRLVNDRLHQTLPAGTGDTYLEPDAGKPLTFYQTMEKAQTTMTPAQIQEVRGLAYHLWLQADRPVGKEIDFWLSAEQQVIQAAAEKATHEAALKSVPAAESAVKKTKSTNKRTK